MGLNHVVWYTKHILHRYIYFQSLINRWFDAWEDKKIDFLNPDFGNFWGP